MGASFLPSREVLWLNLLGLGALGSCNDGLNACCCLLERDFALRPVVEVSQAADFR